MYEIFTDGACRGNPGVASWAFVVYKDKEELGYKRGVTPASTNNAMELRAIKEALAYVARNAETIKESGGVTIHTDSSFCVSVVTQWMDNWERNGWKKKTAGPIKNLEIIQELWALWHKCGKLVGNVQLAKVAGHSGNVGNDCADKHCNIAIDEYLNTERLTNIP